MIVFNKETSIRRYSILIRSERNLFAALSLKDSRNKRIDLWKRSMINSVQETLLTYWFLQIIKLDNQVEKPILIYSSFTKSGEIFTRKRKKRRRRFRKKKCLSCREEYRKSGKRPKKCTHGFGLSLS